MRLPGRLLALATAAAAVAAVTFSSAAHAPPALSASAATQPCLPAPSPGVLPVPPVIDVSTGPSSFDIYVKRGLEVSSKYLYCYVSSRTGERAYTEAPTIRVKQGGTFTMTLHDQIPYGGPSPIPTPPQKIQVVPGEACAWLPYDSPRLPTPNPSASPGGYFGHPRVPQNPAPPWMLGNDTNFHTHGWHVSPYVDNVYKSLAWSPSPNVCVYKFTVRRSQPPGTYWYHAHLHGISDDQVGGGLAGALIVEPLKPDPAAPHADGDVVLLVKNSYRNQANGGVAPPSPQPLRAMNGMAGMPGMTPHGAGDPVQARHYARLAAAARGVPAPAASSPVPFDPFAPGPWGSGWPLAANVSPADYCAAIPDDPNSPNAPDVLSVNGALMQATYGGKTYPAAGPSFAQPAGTVYRYRVINAAANAYVNLQTVNASGKAVPLNIIGRDGVPVDWNKLTAAPDPTKPAVINEPNVFVPPSGRVDILVSAASAPLKIVSMPGVIGSRSATNTPYCTGFLGSAMPARTILAITSRGGAPRTALGAPRTLATRHGVTAAGRYVVAARARDVVRRAITFTMYLDGGPAGFNWLVTETGAQSKPFAPRPTPLPYVERPFWLAQGSLPPNDRFPYVPWIQVHQGDFEEWSLYNASPEIHAFHIHQLTFVATESPFEATDPTRQVFLDTIALPAATLTGSPNANASGAPAPTPTPGYPLLTPSVTKIQIDFTNVDTGVFVFHCHMLFHEDHGMMGVIEVLPPRNGRVQKTF
jgi:FtsP/CotA-like multicopper oxidase with cupredoxin domain